MRSIKFIILFISISFYYIADVSSQSAMFLHTRDGNVHSFDLTEIDSITFTFESDTGSFTGLAAYYPFSGDAADESGNSNHGIVNGATLTQDRHGTDIAAYHFDGVSGHYIFADNSSSLNLRETGSIALWIYISSYGDTTYNKFWHLIGKGAKAGWDSDGYSIFYHDEDALLYGTITNRSQFPTFNRVSFGRPATHQWHHLVLIWDGTELKSYINGQQIGDPIPQTITVPATWDDLVMGKKPSGRRPGYFHGKIDEIYIFTYALSEEEIEQIYNQY